MKRFYIYDPKNHTYEGSFKKLSDAEVALTNFRARHHKDRWKNFSSKQWVKDCKSDYEYYKRCVIREMRLVHVADY